MKQLMLTTLIALTTLTGAPSSADFDSKGRPHQTRFCVGMYELRDLRTGDDINTFPVKCEEALQKIRHGMFCIDMFTVKDVWNDQEISTFPVTCEKALREMKRGLICTDLFEATNLFTKEKVSTFPVKCTDIL